MHNVRDGKSECKRSEIGNVMREFKLDIHALYETKMEEKDA